MSGPPERSRTRSPLWNAEGAWWELEGVVETGDEYAGPNEVAAIARTKAKPKERVVSTDMLDLPFARVNSIKIPAVGYKVRLRFADQASKETVQLTLEQGGPPELLSRC